MSQKDIAAHPTYLTSARGPVLGLDHSAPKGDLDRPVAAPFGDWTDGAGPGWESAWIDIGGEG